MGRVRSDERPRRQRRPRAGRGHPRSVAGRAGLGQLYRCAAGLSRPDRRGRGHLRRRLGRRRRGGELRERAGSADGSGLNMIYVGVGGWTFAPWRGSFYPKALPQAQELAFASRHLTSIEVNGTFYRTQTPATFRKWAGETPAGFVFALKGPGYVTNRSELRASGPGVTRFLESGITELGAKLGPILWQLAPTKKFDEAELAGFLELLPRELGGAPIRHALEVRHDSFKTPACVALMRRFNWPVVYAHSDKYTEIADITGNFVYARLQRSSADHETGYAPDALDA